MTQIYAPTWGSYFVPVPKFLDKYRYSGHAAIMGKKRNNWQDTDYVLKLFNSKLSLARRRYREYVKKGISVGKRPDLIGGGLVRSAGGWDALKGLRKIKAYMKGDERILGNSDFVETVLLKEIFVLTIFFTNHIR